MPGMFPQPPLYHCHKAPAPNVPPLRFQVNLVPKQTVSGPVIDVAISEVSLIVTVTLLQMVLLQVPSALTKYVVLTDGATVMLAPVPANVPPHDVVYHFQLAPVPRLPPLTERVVFLPRQIVVEPVIEVAGTDVS